MVSKKKNFEYFFENLPFMASRQPIKSNNLDKSCMKHAGLLNKHFCKNKILLSPISNFHFSHYKSMESLSCHSNQSSYLIKMKNITLVEGNVLSRYAKFQLLLHIVSEKKIFKRFFSSKIDPFCRPDNQSNTPIWTKVI